MNTRAVLSTALLCVLGTSAVVMMLYRFASFPGLHGDEAWTGLRALEHTERGFFTLHGMRFYAGSVYPYLLSLVFKARGASVESLRLPGLALNLAGLGILLALLLRHSTRSAGLFLALSCTSLLLLLEARIAWEVMAWNLFGLACLAAVAHVFLVRGSPSALAAYLFFAVSMVGALNHFVFVSWNLAFALASAVLAWSGRAGAPASRFFQLNALGMAVVLVACVLQWKLGDEAFQSHSTFVLVALVALPFLATGLWVVLEPVLERLLRAVQTWRSGRVEGSLGRRSRRWWLAALVPFVIMHGVGFSGVLGNDVLYRRLFGYVPPLGLRIAGLAFVAVVLGTVAVACVRTVQTFWAEATDAHGGFWAIVLPVYAACFPLFTARESARHYLLLTMALFYAGALLVPRYLPMFRTRLLVVTLTFAAITQAVAWWGLRSPPRPPLDFRIGWRRETSKHLLSISPVYAMLKREGICRYEGDFFIHEPLEFLRRSEGWDCANPAAATIEYCPNCESTFFFSVRR
ncbi:hypothetical protein [Hyalangium versicolor]|uniref:hypothetical protein n=1 Tax=Hyalangium versicolor TaxID=2861190 RepID=UPI001CCCD229|nr:hypothetical protein [Hyalangium versicolor]